MRTEDRSALARLLLGGTEDKFRYHMASGFGKSDALWFRLLKAKYMDGVNFFSSKTKGSSQFWQRLHKVKHLSNGGLLLRLAMVATVGFGRIVGYMRFHSNFTMRTYIKW